jgi:hypothetical protein
MNIIYLGAEVPSNRVILEKAGAAHMGVSVWGLMRRGLPKTKKYELSNYFPENTSVYVYAGLPANKSFTDAEFEDFAVEYETFIAVNLDRITAFTEVDHPELSPKFIEQQRITAWSDVPEEKFWPVWTGVNLDTYSVSYLNVGIPGHFIEEMPDLTPKARRFNQIHGTRFHALGVAKPDTLRMFPADTTSTLSWLSPMMRGETIVWMNNKLVRYPKRMKDQARPRYKAVYEQAGLDFDKIMADDATEISKLAIWSYQQYELWHDRAGDLVTMSDDDVTIDNAETPPTDVARRGSEMRKLEQRKPDEMTTLPVLGVDISRVIDRDESGHDVVKDVPVVRSSSTSLRMCDTCFVAANCPAYKPQNTCAFNLPVEIKTKEQMRALINALVEIQGQRVAFAKFTEDLNGGYPDPNVGQEMDRFFKMLKTVKELDDSRELIRMTVERQGSGGVLSAIFGDRAQVLKELPNGGLDEQQTNEVIKQVLPVEVEDES